MTLKRYRSNPEGALEPTAVEEGDYRRQLRSRRWNAAELGNPEAEKTDPRIAALAIVALCLFTFAALVLGYATGFWG